MLKTVLGLELMSMLESLSAGMPDLSTQIAEMRMLIHDAAQAGAIPLEEWHLLIEKSAAIRHAFVFRR